MLDDRPSRTPSSPRYSAFLGFKIGGGFVRIPHRFFTFPFKVEGRLLQPVERLTLLVCLHAAGGNNRGLRSQKNLAVMVGVKPRHLRRILQRLEHAALIKVTRRPDPTDPTGYRLLTNHIDPRPVLALLAEPSPEVDEFRRKASFAARRRKRKRKSWTCTPEDAPWLIELFETKLASQGLRGNGLRRALWKRRLARARAVLARRRVTAVSTGD